MGVEGGGYDAAGDLPWLTREAAIALVEAYGAAWMAQDATAMGALFTEDAVFSERPFATSKGVFQGRQGIQEYWRQQISRQRAIWFRQCQAELLLDSEKSQCLAKWEARFEFRGNSGSYKPVWIIQVATIRLRPPLASGNAASGTQGANCSSHTLGRGVLPRIASLEEYWHTENENAPGARKAAAAAAAAAAARGELICKDWLVRGNCRFGTKCYHTHSTAEELGIREAFLPTLEGGDMDSVGQEELPVVPEGVELMPVELAEEVQGPWLPDSAIEAAATGLRRQEEEEAAGKEPSEEDPEMKAALAMLARAAAVVGVDATAIGFDVAAAASQGGMANTTAEPPAKAARGPGGKGKPGKGVRNA
mmetsp:Transcript_18361/g.50365  ORF Transcript_18361/g.50365 Transcript_18361/m.50365 type:complete len:364 (+) Transcript_18361:89-1180(+)